MKGYFVYMFLNEKEEPLYIGLSTNLTTRIEVQHFKSSNGNLSQECIEETYSILYHTALSIDDMKIKERYLINTLNPKLYNNKMNNENKFSFTIEIDWKLYSIDKSKLIQDKEKRLCAQELGMLFLLKIKTFIN
jgi:excinuclease UvrABC nuclease subunit